jgi:hypothetical protein
MNRIYVDFQNADPLGRVRLNTKGTYRDLERLGVTLSNGMRLLRTDGELEADGKVEYSDDEAIWVARIDWRALSEIAP